MHRDGYGPLRLHRLRSAADYWHLHDAVVADGSGFAHNRALILDAMMRRRLFGLVVEETDAMFARGAWGSDPIFRAFEDSRGNNGVTMYLLPCFAWVEPRGECVVIWVHSGARRLGLGRALVRAARIKRAVEVLPGSEPFWEACRVKAVSRGE